MTELQEWVLSGHLLVDAKFDARVSRGDGCWEWTGTISTEGYGRYWANGRWWYAHRVAYEYLNGPLPGGIYVCHTCDNRKCLRPDHLFAGTIADNNRDMWSKGRGIVNGTSQPGESNPRSVLTQRDVDLIKRLVAAGVKQKVCANVFTVSSAAISDIVRGRRWATT